MRGGGGLRMACIWADEEEAGEIGDVGEEGGVGKEAFGIKIVT